MYHTFKEKLLWRRNSLKCNKNSSTITIFYRFISIALHVDKLLHYQDITVGPNDLMCAPFTKFLE